MHREKLYGKWEKEPTFPATGSLKPDGTHGAYFCHMFYNGEYAYTVRVEELGTNAWEATIEDETEEPFQRMRETYQTYQEAMDDAVSWAAGQ